MAAEGAATTGQRTLPTMPSNPTEVPERGGLLLWPAFSGSSWTTRSIFIKPFSEVPTRATSRSSRGILDQRAGLDNGSE